jgi:hypothetical protein
MKFLIVIQNYFELVTFHVNNLNAFETRLSKVFTVCIPLSVMCNDIQTRNLINMSWKTSEGETNLIFKFSYTLLRYRNSDKLVILYLIF